jgi:hypothetical protein
MNITQNWVTVQTPVRRPLYGYQPLPSKTPPRKPPTMRPPPQTFICWRVGGSRPKRKHSTLQSALAERKRILTLRPDAVVLVYELICVYGRPSR